MKIDQSFDFNTWKELAEKDPAAFEQQRQAVLESTINEASAGARQRLRGLQWRIDMERAQCSNPTLSFLKIYKQMWGAVYGKNGLLDALNCKVQHVDETTPTAKILPFDAVRPR